MNERESNPSDDRRPPWPSTRTGDVRLDPSMRLKAARAGKTEPRSTRSNLVKQSPFNRPAHSCER